MKQEAWRCKLSAGAVNAVNKTDNSNNTVNPNSTDKCRFEFARDLVKNYVLTNTAYPTKQRYFQADNLNLAQRDYNFILEQVPQTNTYVNGGLLTKADGIRFPRAFAYMITNTGFVTYNDS